MEKHLPYFSFIESIKKDTCPICNLVNKNIDKYIEDLLYEKINDIGIRKKFKENSGFCNYHAHLFLKYNDGIAISLLNKDILIDKINSINKKPPLIKKLKKKTNCQICELKKEYENHYLSIFSEFWNDEVLKNSFISNSFLCIPHLNMLKSKFKSIPDWLLDTIQNKYTIIVNNVNSYLDSCNFDDTKKKTPFTTEQINSWKILTNIIYGIDGM